MSIRNPTDISHQLKRRTYRHEIYDYYYIIHHTTTPGGGVNQWFSNGPFFFTCTSKFCCPGDRRA